MRKDKFFITSLLVFFLLFIHFNVWGQYYNYDKEIRTYKPLKSPIRIFNPEQRILELPFEFTFGNNTYTGVRVFSNGWVTFDKELEINDFSPPKKDLRTLIAPFLNEKAKNKFYNIYVQYSDNFFTVEWKNRSEAFQLKLNKDGSFEIFYNIKNFDDNVFIGIINDASAIANKDINFFDGREKSLLDFQIKKVNYFKFLPKKEPVNYLGHWEHNNCVGYSESSDGVNPMAASPKATAIIGTGTSGTTYQTPYRGYWHDARIQMIYTASELSAAGLSSGDIITGIGFYVSEVNSTQPYNGFTIKMAHTAQSSFSSSNWISASFTTVYSANYTVSSTGWNVHNFSTNFSWNGTDNIVIEVCFDNSSYTQSDEVQYTSTTNNTVCYAEQDGAAGCSLTAENTSANRPNLQIIYSNASPCTEPSDQPTGLSLNSTGPFTIDGSFNAAASSPDGYLVVRSYNSTLSANPVDGTTYNSGDALGGGVVVQRSSSTSFTDDCLDPDRTVYYFIFSYDDFCSGGPDYNTNNPLTGSTSTQQWNQPTNLNLSSSTANSFDGSFTASTGSDGYLVVYSTSSSLTSTPVDGNTYSAGDAIGNGTVIQMSSATNFSQSCLATNKTYYVFVFAYRSGCSGDPYYKTDNPLTGSVVLTGGSADETIPYTNYFDSDDGWTYDGVWERGNQTNDDYGPPSGVSGNSVAGTKLNSNYAANNLDDYLTSPTFSLAGSTRPQISFWMDMESESGFDGGTVQLKVNGCSWITINKNDPGYIQGAPNDTDVDGLQDEEDGWSGRQPDGEWQQVKIDLLSLTTSGLDNITTDDIIQVRFWFGSDGSSSSYPGWYIDNFKLDEPDPCEEPKACATNLHLTPNGTTINGIFSPADPEPTGYLIVRSTNSSLSAMPQNGTFYSSGDPLGGGIVVQQSADFQFIDEGLSANTTYYYFIFSYNYDDCNGPTYLTSCYLTGNATTGDCSSYSVPWSENFDGVSAPALPDCWTIEDNSAPDDDWQTYSSSSYARSDPNSMYISYDYSNPLDDWAFSPGIYLESGKQYRLTFYYRAHSSSYNESMEVKMGTNNNSGAMTTSLWNNSAFSNTSYQRVDIDFNVSSTGTYYFGWHAYSAKNLYGIHVEDINLIQSDLPPSIYVVNDNYLYKDRGKRITIYGEGLTGISNVTFGGYACTVVSEDGTSAVIDIPPGDYSNDNLVVTTSNGSASTTLTVKTRNIIPVKSGAEPTSDDHPDPSSALDGLYAWWGNNTFDTTKVIQVYSGTYGDQIEPNEYLAPTPLNRLVIEVKLGENAVIVGKTYAFKIETDYTIVKGFEINYAGQYGIYVLGDYDTISYNKVYKAEDAGIYVTGKNIYLEHNLLYDNVNSGISISNTSDIELRSNTIAGNGHWSGGSGYTLNEDRPATGTIYDFEYNASWTQIPFPDDDDYNIELPFDFEFYGYRFNAGDSIAVSSNGHILMEGDIYGPGTGITNSLDYVNHPLYWHGTNASESKVYGNDYFLAPLYDDHYDDGHGGSVRYGLRGAAPNRWLVIVWYQRQHWNYGDGTTDHVTFEAKLFETSNIIQFHYQDMDYGDPDSLVYCKSGTIGIKKNDSTYMQYCFNSEITPNSDVPFALEYVPSPAGGNGVTIDNCTDVSFLNNIFYSYPSNSQDVFYTIYATNSDAISYSDFNIFYKNGNQYLMYIGSNKYSDLTSWPNAGANDIEADPKFVDVSNKDFHLKSDNNGESFHNGEWPPLTAGSGAWTTDGEATPSPGVDGGYGDYDMEQEDNGDARNIGCYGNTLQATKTAILQGYWTGAVSTEWDNQNNWSDHIVPDKSKDAIIPDVSSTTNRFPYIDILASCKDLEIQPGAYVIIAPDGGLTVEGVLKNQNGYDGLIIESTLAGDGSLIHSTDNVPAKVYRYFYGTRYHYISTPVDVAPVSDFNTNNFYYWDASMEWYGMGPPIDYRPWITPSSTNLDLFKGYAYYYYTDTILFQGNLNQGNFSATLHKYTGSLTQGGPNDQGWNLLGNPYPSSINWDMVAADASFPDPNTQMESAIYLFDDYDASAEQKNYRYYVPASGTGGTYGVGTADATRYIPVGQGFFVRALQDGVTFTISNDCRAHSLQEFYKNEHHDNLVRLELAKDDYEDELVIRLIQPATTEFDPQYDARKLFVGDMNLPQVCAINSDRSISAISSLPLANNDLTIPLLIRCNQGTYKFKVKEQTLIDGRRLYLVDKQNNEVIELRQGTEYQITFDGGVDSTRFELKFAVNNEPQVQNPIANQIIYEDESFDIELKDVFYDPDGDELTYNIIELNSEQLPQWVNVSGLALNMTPTNGDIGLYTFEFTATDPYGAQATILFNVQVINTNDAPYVNNQIPDYEIVAGDLFKFELPEDAFADVDPDDELSYLFENVPSWIEVDDYKLIGIPSVDQAGIYEITVKAVDLQGAQTQQSFHITVLPPTNVNYGGNDFVIAPNPTNGPFEITSKFNNFDVIVLDMNGKVLYKKHSNSTVFSTDLSALPSAPYKVLIKTSEKSYLYKIVKD